MKYQVTSTKTVEAKVSSYTNVALDIYRKVKKIERRLEAMEEALIHWVDMIPEEDMAHYVAITEEIDKQFEEEKK